MSKTNAKSNTQVFKFRFQIRKKLITYTQIGSEKIFESL